MNVEIFRVSYGQFADLLGPHPNTPLILDAAKLSEDIIVGLMDGEPICFVGLAPQSFLSETAYIWMVVTDLGLKYRLTFARHSHTFIDTILAKYPRIVGHCFAERSAKWLKANGAVFVSETEFEFRRK